MFIVQFSQKMKLQVIGTQIGSDLCNYIICFLIDGTKEQYVLMEGINNSIWVRGEVMLCDDVISEADCIIISFPLPTITELVLDPCGCIH